MVQHADNAPAPGGASVDDGFVNVWFGGEGDAPKVEKDKTSAFYDQWQEKGSAKHSMPPMMGAEALRKLYPKHSLVMTQDYKINLLSLPGVFATPLENNPLITNLFFMPLPRNASPLPGVLLDQVVYAGFKLNWDKYEFILYIVQYPYGFGTFTQQFILHEGSEGPARSLLIATGSFADELHDEIWVFNQGFWSKDHGLWQEIQKADWKDVILKEEFKKALKKDVYGFFASEAIYKELAIPWKRGLIMYGPPGNGKTISLKTIMKTCGDDGFAPLYVKSFQSWKGEEGAMADVFDKARQLAPCVIILEDLDSLINDRNRSFFLNQLDGLNGNNGLLIIGTTNHFERLDPGLSTRPSRFDRKFKFDDPDHDERALYAQYWQKKLLSNKEIDFPDRLVTEVADITDRFSFAYLKEAFVSSLVTLAGYEGDHKPSFETVLKSQIETLRKQLDKQLLSTIVRTEEQSVNEHAGQRNRRNDSYGNDIAVSNHTGRGATTRPQQRVRVADPLVDYYSRIGIQRAPDRIFTTAAPERRTRERESDSERGKTFRDMLDRLSLSQQDVGDASNPSCKALLTDSAELYARGNSMSYPSDVGAVATPGVFLNDSQRLGGSGAGHMF